MKTFTANIDERLDKTLNELSDATGKSRSEVFRRAVAILKYVEDHRAQGLKLTLSDSHDRVRKEVAFF